VWFEDGISKGKFFHMLDLATGLSSDQHPCNEVPPQVPEEF